MKPSLKSPGGSVGVTCVDSVEELVGSKIVGLPGYHCIDIVIVLLLDLPNMG